MPLTESIVIAELFFPSLTVDIPDTSDTGLSLNNHLKFTGVSPDTSKHWTLADSPKLEGSSPKSNEAIFGGTNQKGKEQLKVSQNENCDLASITKISGKSIVVVEREWWQYHL